MEAIRAPETYEIPEPTIGIDEQAINAVEWGIDRIRADDVWSTFGVRGEGIVVGSIDTGVNFQHPALVRAVPRQQRRRVQPRLQLVRPVKRVRRPGARATTTTTAPTRWARWSATTAERTRSGSRRGPAGSPRRAARSNTCSDSALLASGQWMLAPTRLDGTGADPAQRPHIVNNSWGGPAVTAGTADTIDAWRAAGIFPAFSDGNSGPACGTAGSPGDDEQAFASGSFDINNVIASTSGRGAGPAARSSPTWPRPGVNVRSSIAERRVRARSAARRWPRRTPRARWR